MILWLKLGVFVTCVGYSVTPRARNEGEEEGEIWWREYRWNGKREACVKVACDALW